VPAGHPPAYHPRPVRGVPADVHPDSRRLRQPADPRRHEQHHDRDGHPERVPDQPGLRRRIRPVGDTACDRSGRDLRLRAAAWLAPDRGVPVRVVAAEALEREAPPRHRASRPGRGWTRFVLPVYSWLVIAYLVLPIFVMVAYSFNKVTTGLPQVSFTWNGFT